MFLDEFNFLSKGVVYLFVGFFHGCGVFGVSLWMIKNSLKKAQRVLGEKRGIFVLGCLCGEVGYYGNAGGYAEKEAAD